MSRWLILIFFAVFLGHAELTNPSAVAPKFCSQNLSQRVDELGKLVSRRRLEESILRRQIDDYVDSAIEQYPLPAFNSFLTPVIRVFRPELSFDEIRTRVLLGARLYIGNSFDIFLHDLELSYSCDLENSGLSSNKKPTAFSFTSTLAVPYTRKLTDIDTLLPDSYIFFWNRVIENIRFSSRNDPSQLYVRSELTPFSFVLFVADRLYYGAPSMDLSTIQRHFEGLTSRTNFVSYSIWDDLILQKRELEAALAKLNKSGNNSDFRATNLVLRLRLDEVLGVLNAYSVRHANN